MSTVILSEEKNGVAAAGAALRLFDEYLKRYNKKPNFELLYTLQGSRLKPIHRVEVRGATEEELESLRFMYKQIYG